MSVTQAESKTPLPHRWRAPRHRAFEETCGDRNPAAPTMPHRQPSDPHRPERLDFSGLSVKLSASLSRTLALSLIFFSFSHEDRLPAPESDVHIGPISLKFKEINHISTVNRWTDSLYPLHGYGLFQASKSEGQAKGGSSMSTPPEPSPVLGREIWTHRASSHQARARMSPKLNASTLLFFPKTGGDTEGVENLTLCTQPTFCRAGKSGAPGLSRASSPKRQFHRAAPPGR